MTFLNGLHGTFAALLICLLLYIDELGVPMPFAPNEALLLVAGLLIAGGALPPLLFLPLAVLAMTGGMVSGYYWARAVGSDRLRAVAGRLGAANSYDRAAARVRRAGPVNIAISRLIPGVRVYATLVAGAAEVDLRLFMAGAFPAIVIWAGVFTLLGILVGVPAEHLLSRFEKLLITGILLVALGVGSFVAARRIPRGRREPTDAMLHSVPGRVRLGLALLLDLGMVVSLIAGVDRVLRGAVHRFHPENVNELIILSGGCLLAYIVLTRRGPGLTAGEGLFDVSYVHPGRGDDDHAPPAVPPPLPRSRRRPGAQRSARQRPR